MVNQNIGRGLLLAAVALVFLFQAPLAILTPCERALRAERFGPITSLTPLSELN
jgi:hypothetical protein